LNRKALAAEARESSLCQTYEQRLFAYLLRLTGHRETAEDLTQETVIRAIRDLRRHPDNAESPQLKAWLFRIATNLATDHFRRQRRIAWLPFLPGRHGGAGSDSSDTLAERDLVTQALQRLSPETATILLLKDAEGFSALEIASMVGLTYEAVKKRLARAREQFRIEYLRLGGE
jgi:RNA polymerase sigma-70 factor (ECF subfamily)